MKTAISLPDDLFEDADRVAERLGLSRSELYQRAIAAFVREHSGEALTAAINRALGASPTSLDPALQRMQSLSLGADEGAYEDWVDTARMAGERKSARGMRASESRGGKKRG